ncbi:MAG: helix-turn-helix domain-containing protein [Bdellovibrionota bacterium]
MASLSDLIRLIEPASPADFRAARKALGLTQVEYSKRLGVSQAIVSEWELGSSFPRKDHLAAIVRLLREQERKEKKRRAKS